jgi:FOG: Ankyrin repeat
MKKYFTIILLLMIFGLGFSQTKNVFDIARSGTLEEMKTLVSQNPDIINSKNERGFTPLILACYRGNTEVAKYLIDNVKDLNYVSPEGTALSSLCINYNKELVEKMLSKNADPNLPDSNGNTALMWAVKRGNIELAKILLDNKADKTVKDSMGISAFEYAIKSNNNDMINLLKF